MSRDRARGGEVTGGAGNYYKEVKVCSRCYHVYSILDRARDILRVFPALPGGAIVGAPAPTTEISFSALKRAADGSVAADIDADLEAAAIAHGAALSNFDDDGVTVQRQVTPATALVSLQSKVLVQKYYTARCLRICFLVRGVCAFVTLPPCSLPASSDNHPTHITIPTVCRSSVLCSLHCCCIPWC